MFGKWWVWIALVLLGACATQRQPEVPPMGAALPSLNNLTALPRGTSATSQRPGSDFLVSGGAVAVAGDDAVFTPAGGEVAYAIYEFATHDTTIITSASYSLSNHAEGGTVWLAISDFARGSWRMLAASELSHSFQFVEPAGTFSSGGSTYLAVISFGDSLSVNSLALSFSGPVWQRSFGIEGLTGYVDKTEVTPNGVYIAATFHNTPAEPRSLLVRYSLDGELLASVMAPRNHSARAFAVAPDGSVYYGLRPDDSLEQLLLKLDSGLNLVWAKQYAITDVYVSFESLAVDPSTGDVIILGDGYTGLPTGGPKLLLRVSPQGDLLWQRGSDPTFHWRLPDLEIDPSTGEIFAAGTSGMFAPDWVVFRWDSAGGLLQYTQIANPVPHNEASLLDSAMVREAGGNLYLTASDLDSWKASSFLLRFDSTGALAQAVRMAGFGSEISGVGVDSVGNVRIIGYSGQAQVFAPDLTYQHTLTNAVKHMYDFAGATFVVTGGAGKDQWPMKSVATVTVSDCRDELVFVDYTPGFSDMSGTFTPFSTSLEPFDGLLDEFSPNHIRVGCAYIDVN